MINVSESYKNAVKASGREFVTRCTFNDTPVINEIIDVSIEDAFNSDNNELKIGGAVSKKAIIELYNAGKLPYSTAKIKIESGLKLPDNNIEWVNMGTFYPSKVESEDEYKTLKIESYDLLAMLNKHYEPKVSVPTTDTAIVNDICNQYGIEFVGNTLGCKIENLYDANANQTIGYMAGLQGMNAYITRDNKLDFKWYVMPTRWAEIDNKVTWQELENKTWFEISRREST